MTEPTVIPPGGGEIIGDAPDRRVEILCDREALHATWTRFGPRRDGADPHIHRRHSDLFYVLAGELTVALGPEGEEVVVPAGTLVRVPPLVVHGFRNAGDTELRYVNLHAPGAGFADYMRGLRDRRAVPFDQEPPPADGDRPAGQATIGAGEPLADGVVLLTDVEEIAIAEVSLGGSSQPPHVHRRHAESFYVLEGELALTAGDRELRAPPGSWVDVPPGVAHAVHSPGPEPARCLDLHSPGCGFGAHLRALLAGDDGAAFDEWPAAP
jgi:mannose-6-phosphate isomerase-like protein (cupin superfamily)